MEYVVRRLDRNIVRPARAAKTANRLELGFCRRIFDCRIRLARAAVFFARARLSAPVYRALVSRKTNPPHPKTVAQGVSFLSFDDSRFSRRVIFSFCRHAGFVERDESFLAHHGARRQQRSAGGFEPFSGRRACFSRNDSL